MERILGTYRLHARLALSPVGRIKPHVVTRGPPDRPSPHVAFVSDLWTGTSLALPDEPAGRRWHCALSGLEVKSTAEAATARLQLDKAFTALPVVLLMSSDRTSLTVAQPPLATKRE